MTKTTAFDPGLVRELAKILDETSLTEIEFESGTQRVRVSRAPGPVMATVQAPAAMMAAPLPAAAALASHAQASEFAAHPAAIKSPMVGVVYLGAEPGAAPFVKPGDNVAEGDTLVLIEAMKTFNPVRATRSGRVTRVFVNDGSPVEYGEPLLLLE